MNIELTLDEATFILQHLSQLSVPVNLVNGAELLGIAQSCIQKLNAVIPKPEVEGDVLELPKAAGA